MTDGRKTSLLAWFPKRHIGSNKTLPAASIKRFEHFLKKEIFEKDEMMKKIVYLPIPKKNLTPYRFVCGILEKKKKIPTHHTSK